MTAAQPLQRSSSFAALWLFVTALLLAPAVWNGAPLLYPDSMGYFRSGEASLDFVGKALGQKPATLEGPEGSAVVLDPKDDGVQTSRSIYYGVPLAALYKFAGGAWAVAVAQSALVGIFLCAGLRRFFPNQMRLQVVGVIAITTVGGLGFYSSLLLPDVLLGVTLISLATLFAFHSKLGRREVRFWLTGVMLGILAHKAHLFVVLATVGGMGLVLWALRRVPGRLLGSIALAVILAFLGHAAVDHAVKRLTGAEPVSPPFLLARLVGDGTAEKYLAQHCGDAEYQTCRYLPRMPMSANQFLWSRDPRLGAFGQATLEDRRKIISESSAIVLGTLKEQLPLQALKTASNVMRQTFCVGVKELGNVRSMSPEMALGFGDALRGYSDTEVGREAMPLAAISLVMVASYALSMIGILLIAATSILRRSRFEGHTIVGMGILLLGLLTNAAISGGISGVFDRYQGRVAWLAIFGLLVVWSHQRVGQTIGRDGVSSYREEFAERRTAR